METAWASEPAATAPFGHRRRRRLIAMRSRWACVAVGLALGATACSGGGKSATPDPVDQQVTAPGERDVQFASVGNVHLAGSLLLPAAATKSPNATVPGVLVIPDIGPGDRDGPISAASEPDRIGADLATSFGSVGLASLRYDGRGTGASKLDPTVALSFDDTVADAKAGLDFLAQRKETAGPKLAVVGYDLGGLVALRLAATDPRVGRVVLVSTPGRPLVDVQAARLAAAYGQDSADALRSTVAEMLSTGKLPALEDMRSELRPLLPATNVAFLSQLYGLDPAVDAAKVKVPMLIVTGERSTGVSGPDSARLAQSLAAKAEVAVAANANESLDDVLPPPAIDPSDPNSPDHEHGAGPPPSTNGRDPAIMARIAQWLQSGLTSGPG